MRKLRIGIDAAYLPKDEKGSINDGTTNSSSYQAHLTRKVRIDIPG